MKVGALAPWFLILPSWALQGLPLFLFSNILLAIFTIILALLIGALGGLLPDILEPPTSPQHRGLFHYGIGLLLLILLGYNLYYNGLSYFQGFFTEFGPLLFFSGVLGYASHIILDVISSVS